MQSCIFNEQFDSDLVSEIIINKTMNKKIQYFPITMFAIVMGLTGLAIVFSKFIQLNWIPDVFYTITLYFVSILFVLFFVFYGLKAILHFKEVLADFKHRIRINFFSAISISFLLLSIAYHPTSHAVSEILWWIGMIAHSIIMLHTISFWIQHNFEIHFFNPAWFIPVVGNIIVPVMGVEFMPISFSFFYFSVGAFFWVVLFVIFLNRVIFHDQLPQKFIPTLFILIAPPAIGFIAYYRITGNWDLVCEFLLNMTYFFVLLLIFLMKKFKNLKFFISWWAFTFPLDALTIASVLAYQLTKKPFYMYMSWISLTIAVSFIIIVAIKTIQKMKKNEICVKED